TAAGRPAAHRGDPYDFTRKRLSVLVDDNGTPLLITKGAFASVLKACTTARSGGQQVPLDSVRDQVQHPFEELSAAGYRVLGLATRQRAGATTASDNDETGMTLV